MARACSSSKELGFGLAKRLKRGLRLFRQKNPTQSRQQSDSEDLLGFQGGGVVE
jgi:hypothetical protein